MKSKIVKSKKKPTKPQSAQKQINLLRRDVRDLKKVCALALNGFDESNVAIGNFGVRLYLIENDFKFIKDSYNENYHVR